MYGSENNFDNTKQVEINRRMKEGLDLKGAIMLNLPSYLLMTVRIKAELFGSLSGPTFLISIVYGASSAYPFLATEES